MKTAHKFRCFLSLCCAFALLCTLLTSCGKEKSADDLAVEIQESFKDSATITMNAAIKADYGDRVYDFSVKYTGSDTGGTIEILSPEEISGISAKIDENGITLMYDDAEIFTGNLDADGLSPVDSIPMVIDAWKNGLITETYIEGDDIKVTYRISDTTNLKTTFDKETFLPISVEIMSNGFAVLYIEVYNIIVD